MSPSAAKPSATSNPAALAQAAEGAMRAGRVDEARRLLEQLVAIDRDNAAQWLNLAATRRATSDVAGAMSAVGEALRVEPLYFPALLMKASLLERQGKSREAAVAYGVALMQAPPDDRLDANTLSVVQRGRRLHHQYLGELRSHLDRTVLSAMQSTTLEEQRLAAFIDTTLGLRPRAVQQPTHYFYPGLPPVEFWPIERFPWLAQLEAATPIIQRELAGVLGATQGFTPYVDYNDGVPLEQWATLNRSLDWSAFHFYHYGRRFPENCARCPQTLQALAAMPQPQVDGRMPAAMFSVLKPKTRIPPHTGVANVRLVMHLPLIVPPGCGFRVGNVVREWQVGQAFVFDDTIEHEAWNDSDETRVVLIADLWHPDLSAAERDGIGRAMLEMDAFNGVTTALPL